MKDRGLTHCYDIASHRIAEGEIPSNSNKHIEESRNAYASDNHSRGSEVRIIAYLVQNREHLEICQYTKPK